MVKEDRLVQLAGRLLPGAERGWTLLIMSLHCITGYSADSVPEITDIFAEADQFLFRRRLNNESPHPSPAPT